MDPVAHTLFGAALAESGLKRHSRYATATLLIGANLPDIDVIAGLWGSDMELYFRRGYTHGILALLLWPMLLVAGVAIWHMVRAPARERALARAQALSDRKARRGEVVAASADDIPYRPGVLLALATLALWSHPLLDWMNTYGVRVLMPFDQRWFYGDTLFIVEPWFWLLAGAGVVLARSATRPAAMGWLILAAAASALVLTTDLVSVTVKAIWCLGIAAIIALRQLRPGWARSVTVARSGLLLLVAYVGASYALARSAEARVAAEHPEVTLVQANPSPANPFTPRMILAEPGRYRIITAEGGAYDVPRSAPDSVVLSALADPSIRGFANWMRFPVWTVEEAEEHWIVRFRDLRYQGPDMPTSRGIGQAEVIVPKKGDAAAVRAVK